MAGTELAKAYVQIIPSADGIKGKLTSALSGEASSAGDSAGKTAGLSLGASIKKVILAAGIGTALKSAISEGANLQQSIGGIETLFKDSADKVITNAQNAYKTAGLSANDYMESVTSFSASLLQGLAGDTNKAADVADMALTDMSDNANKMGTSMEAIQNAYQGFAKQNYTMLDNLKLGYGGTKTEMQRLLADAQAFSGVKYDINNLSDVYEAIHVIQGEMSISGRTAEEAAAIIERTGRSSAEVYEQLGTTAKESASTFSGSLASMKAAVSNLLGNLSLGEDIKPAMDALIKSTGTFLFKNLLPMVGNILTGLIDYIVDTAVNTDWTSVITQMLTTIKDALVVGIETYFGADASVLNGVFDSFINNIPVIAQTIQDAFSILWEGVKYIWDTVGVPIFDAIMSVIQFVSDNWGTISGLFKEYFQILWDSCSVFWESIGKPIWDAIGFAIGEVQEIFAEYMPLILEFAQNAMAGIKDTWESHLKPCFEAIGNFLNTVLKPAFEFVFDTIIKPLIENVFKTIKNLWNNTLKPVFDGICDFLTGVFTADWETAMGGIHKIVEGAFLAVRDIVEGIIGFFDDAIGKIKEFLGFTNEANGVEVTTTTTTTTTGGVEKYASGAVLTRATAFGYNPFTGKTMVGGEAGAEAIAPIGVLQKYVRQAVAEQNQGMYMAFNRMVELLENYMPEIAANSHKQIVMNNGVLVGELAPGIDREIGEIASWKGRGNR